MGKRLVGLLCILCYVSISYSLTYGEQVLDDMGAYDLNGLLSKSTKRLQNSLLHREDLFENLLQISDVDRNFTLKLSQNISGRCMLDLTNIYMNIKAEWALKILDSFGKPESSIMVGNYKWIGDYKECIGTRVNTTFLGRFDTKYCSVTWSLKNLSLPFSFVSGVCVPDSCSTEDVRTEALLLLRMAGTRLHVNNTDSILAKDAVKCLPRERHLTTAAKAMIGLLSFIFAFTVLGSSITAVKYFAKVFDDFKASPSSVYVYEHNQAIIKDDINDLQKDLTSDDKSLLKDCDEPNKSKGCLQKVETFFQCFCIFTNGAKLLNTETSEGELLCIHGIRFLSMSWVILGHSYIFGFSEMKNPLGVVPLVDNFAFQAILQAFFSVDSFFVLSGFLMTYLFMKEYTKRKASMSWAYFYIHRYVRLTPMYMVLLGFSASVFFFLGSGPYWPDTDYDPSCRKVWWRNLLYINNFGLSEGQCFGHAWYLANDMQFFVISPIFLITLFRWPVIGYTLIGIFLLASCLANFFITYHFDLGNGIITFLNKGLVDYKEVEQQFLDYFDKLYVKPYTRIGPYLIGMLAGYLLFKRKAMSNPKHSLAFVSIGWILALSVTLTTVYGLYHRNLKSVESSIYNAFNRISYAFGLAWVIYVCLVGQGGVVNRILSFKLFIPLSRLTYAAYLIHPMIITWYFATVTTSLEFTHANIVTLFLGFMLITYALSLPVALVLESPIVSLEKLIRKIFVKEQKSETVN